MDQSALIRQWTLLKLLASRGAGLTVRELSEEAEVSQKTIRRDLATFQTVGFPVEETTGDFGRKSYRLAPGRAVAELSFTYEEALALYLGRKFLQPLAGTVIWQAAEQAFKKARACLGDRALKYLDKIAGAFHETAFGLSDYSRHAEILDRLLLGIEDRHVVFITYRSQRSTEPVTYDIHPYRLTRHQGSLYLHGYKPDDEEFRTWRVDRIEAAEVHPMPFAIPSDLDLDARLAGSFGIYEGDEQIHVKIRFSPRVARFVQEKHWHASQRCTPQRDGSLLVEFDLSSTVEVKCWALSFGRDAEVLEPPDLRDEMAAEVADLLALYHPADRQRQRTRPPRRLTRDK